MRFRTLALALALSCGVTGMVQAAPKKAAHAVKVPKAKKQGTSKVQASSKAAPRVKPRKAQRTHGSAPSRYRFSTAALAAQPACLPHMRQGIPSLDSSQCDSPLGVVLLGRLPFPPHSRVIHGTKGLRRAHVSQSSPGRDRHIHAGRRRRFSARSHPGGIVHQRGLLQLSARRPAAGIPRSAGDRSQRARGLLGPARVARPLQCACQHSAAGGLRPRIRQSRALTRRRW